MKITYEDQYELSVITLKGELIGPAGDLLRRAAIERIDARIRDFVIDLSGINAIDSQGLESLIWLQEQCVDRLGQVRLAACPSFVGDILKITRLAGRFECHDLVENAVQSLGVTQS